MKLTMQMTLDGLLRALKAKAHQIAEEREEQSASGKIAGVDELRRHERGEGHDFSRL